ncbi:MAG: hypothetical protein ACLVI9_07150 [Anaerostipes hadrus]
MKILFGQVLDDHPTSEEEKKERSSRFWREESNSCRNIAKIAELGFVIPDNLRFDSDIFVSKSRVRILPVDLK